MLNIGDPAIITATAAIEQGQICAPPALSEETLFKHGEFANASGKKLIVVRNFLKYKDQPLGPTLVIDGDCVFELVDEFDPISRKGVLAAAQDQAWFRVVSEDDPVDDALEFLTWCYDEGSWTLTTMDQYIA